MKLVTFSNGISVNLDTVLNYSAVGNVITFTLSDSSTIALTANNPSAVIGQIRRFLLSKKEAFVCNVAVVQNLAFTSIAPNTIGDATVQSYVIAGTDFVALGITNIQFVNGVYLFGPLITVDSDIQITTSSIALTPTGTWTVQYSTDTGVTWLDTGLTVPVT